MFSTYPLRILEGLGFAQQQFLVNSGGFVCRGYVPDIAKSLIVGQYFVDVIGDEDAIRRAFDHGRQQDVGEGELSENLGVSMNTTDWRTDRASTVMWKVFQH